MYFTQHWLRSGIHARQKSSAVEEPDLIWAVVSHSTQKSSAWKT